MPHHDDDPDPERRRFMLTGMTAGLAAGAGAIGAGYAQPSLLPSLLPGAALATQMRTTIQPGIAGAMALSARALGVLPGPGDVTTALQAAVDKAAEQRLPLMLEPGQYRMVRLELRPGSQLVGIAGQTRLHITLRNRQAGLKAEKADGLRLEQLIIEGPESARKGLMPKPANALTLLHITDSSDIEITRCQLRQADTGLFLKTCSGRVQASQFQQLADKALMSVNARGLQVIHNQVSACGNNGIQIWRTDQGPDGTLVAHNQISGIQARAGGDGQNGNGINVFRAGNVMVTGNQIADCAFTAIRANAANNVQIISNAAHRLGEVAIYSEFGFEGALIAQNLVDQAGTGISVTNYNDGGRLAVVQGNLVRNLKTNRQHRSEERGVGIQVEADSCVTGNNIEHAERFGLVLGWGPYLRDVIATGNLIRHAGIGIAISATPKAGYVMVTNNFIAKTRKGGIRAVNYDKPTGSDLARNSAESFRNFAIAANVSL